MRIGVSVEVVIEKHGVRNSRIVTDDSPAGVLGLRLTGYTLQTHSHRHEQSDRDNAGSRDELSRTVIPRRT